MFLQKGPKQSQNVGSCHSDGGYRDIVVMTQQNENEDNKQNNDSQIILVVPLSFYYIIKMPCAFFLNWTRSFVSRPTTESPKHKKRIVFFPRHSFSACLRLGTQRHTHTNKSEICQ